jgi:Fe2+ transport system protein FeoA
MNLYDAPANKELKVTDIFSGLEAKRRLLSIGIRQSDILIKLNSPPWGAVLVKNISTGSTKLAVGRNLARKIMVDYAS